VPAKLGERGLEEVMQINLTTEEKADLQRSAKAVQDLVDVLRKNSYL
jgi:malate/lactate dehydrogenase